MKHYFALLLIFVSLSCESQNKENSKKPLTLKNTEELDTATFAGGCFWCVEAVFDRLEGVQEAVSGYSGGSKADANYNDVSYGRTEHAEAVEIYYKPSVISFNELLEAFFATHDPTQLNRQGPDVGKQYRSEVFFHNENQRKETVAIIRKLQESKFDKPIVTKVSPYKAFYIAEDYHQDYYNNNPDDPYVRSVTKPKILKFEKEFKEKLKPQFP